MARTKTQATGASIEEYLLSRGSEQQRVDCRALMAMLGRLTQETPYMWGPSIVGFGRYRYTYESGHSGEAPLAGFAIRGRELVLYLDPDESLLSRLGPHKMGKSCLYFKRLADLDAAVLEALLVRSIAAIRQRHP